LRSVWAPFRHPGPQLLRFEVRRAARLVEELPHLRRALVGGIGPNSFGQHLSVGERVVAQDPRRVAGLLVVEKALLDLTKHHVERCFGLFLRFRPQSKTPTHRNNMPPRTPTPLPASRLRSSDHGAWSR
jgi:hypothetical protein